MKKDNRILPDGNVFRVDLYYNPNGGEWLAFIGYVRFKGLKSNVVNDN